MSEDYNKKTNENKIEGRNAVLEAFRSGKPVDKLFVLDGCQDGPVRTIIREARKHDTIIQFVEKERLHQLSETGRHQGVIAYTASYEYAEVEDMLALAEEKSSRIDSNRGKNICRCTKLYTGSKSYKSGKDNGRTEKRRSLVCLCRYGRREDV